MNITPPSRSASAHSLEHEHRQLHREIEEWRRWWQELSQLGEPHFGEMGDRLAQFREHLATHFQHEEFRGPLSGPVPSLAADQVAAIWQEHAQLLAELDDLIRRLHACGSEIGCWGEARQAFETFLDRLHAHEVHESKIVAGLIQGNVS